MDEEWRALVASEPLQPFFESLEFEFVDDPGWSAPDDSSYLSGHDRADPDVMANVAAMAETNRLISWFGQDSRGFLGWWRGPDGTDLGVSPIVRLDTEGQYELVATNLPDYLIASVFDEDVDGVLQALSELTIASARSVEEVDTTLRGYADPNDLRGARYNAHKLAARSDVESE